MWSGTTALPVFATADCYITHKSYIIYIQGVSETQIAWSRSVGLPGVK